MKIIPVINLIKGFVTFFALLLGAYVINNIVSPILDIAPTSMWKITITLGWYLIMILAVIIIPIVVTIGPENLVDK